VSADQIAVRYVGQGHSSPVARTQSVGAGSARLAWRTPDPVVAAGKQPACGLPEALRTGRHRSGTRPILAETGSILDRVQAQAQRLQASLGVKDRVLVGGLSRLRPRDRAPRADGREGAQQRVGNSGCAGRHAERAHRLFQTDVRPDALAFQADITRVITLSMDHEASMAHLHQPEHRRRVPSAVASRQ